MALLVLGALVGCTGRDGSSESGPSVAGVAGAPEPAAAQERAAPRPAGVELPEAGEWFYGVYLNGHKVGWMRSVVEIGEEVTLGLDLDAEVGGLGAVSKVELRERRSYRRSDGTLASLTFSQRAATGATRVEGTVRDGAIALTIQAGGHTSEQRVAIDETLEDAMVTHRLAARAEVGAEAKATRFDPSVLEVVDSTYKVTATEERMLAGVATRTVKIDADYPRLGIQESSWLDVHGVVLESKVGGFFVARLEPPDVAKRLDYSQDLLVSAVVPGPPGIAAAAAGESLDLTFTGFGDAPPPSSTRQRVEVEGDRVHLSLRREAVPSVPLAAAHDANDPMLAPTPFIQSTDPAIVEKAREVVGDSKDLYTAVQRLSAFVYEHVRDEYVPAYSNALEALATGRGDCTEHAILFVALCRAVGIPARVAVGIAYWPPGKGFGWHAWAEVRLGQRDTGAWLTVDPTWNQPIADVTHIKLADGGPAQQARIVMLLGRLEVVGAP